MPRDRKAYFEKYNSKRTEKRRARYQKERAEQPEKLKASAYKNYHGESIENKVARLEAQGYKCANQACLKPIDISTGHQDHSHETGQRRGVLCGSCNLALGLLKDQAERVEGLASYRRRFE